MGQRAVVPCITLHFITYIFIMFNTGIWGRLLFNSLLISVEKTERRMSVSVEKLWSSFNSAERAVLQVYAEEEGKNQLFQSFVIQFEAPDAKYILTDPEFSQLMVWVRKMEEKRLPEVRFYKHLDNLKMFLDSDNLAAAVTEFAELKRISNSLSDPITLLLSNQAEEELRKRKA